jgi:hypothetical protein
MRMTRQYVLRKVLRARFGNISEMTLWRWERDPRLAFPQALIINGRRYYDLAEIEEWERAQAASLRQDQKQTGSWTG